MAKSTKSAEAKFNYFSECKTAEDCKARYKVLVKELHPDNNRDKDTTKEFQKMQAEFTKAFNSLKDKHATKDGKIYEKATGETAKWFINLIDELCKLANVNIEICGSWIWVSGDTKACKDKLKELGFWFSAKKSAWYYNGGSHKHTGSNYSMDDIRNMWGSQHVNSADEQSAIA